MECEKVDTGIICPNCQEFNVFYWNNGIYVGSRPEQDWFECENECNLDELDRIGDWQRVGYDN